MTKRAAAATFLFISAASGATATGIAPPPAAEGPTGRIVLGLHPPEEVMVMDVASGSRVRRRLPGGALCHGPLMATGDRVLWTSSRGVLESRALTLRGPARRLGRAPMALAGGDNRLWLMRLRYGRGIRAVDVRVMTATGLLVMRSRHPAPPGYPSAATARSLVIERGGRTWEWEPGTGRVRRAPGAILVATRGSRSAWCSPSCRRVSLTGPGGSVTSAAIPGITLTPRGSLSPDGRMLAMPAYRGTMARTRIALVDTATGAASLVPGAVLSAEGALDWSDGGGWLYFAAPDRRVRAYRPADGRMLTLCRGGCRRRFCSSRRPAARLRLTRSTSRRARGSRRAHRRGRTDSRCART